MVRAAEVGGLGRPPCAWRAWRCRGLALSRPSVVGLHPKPTGASDGSALRGVV